MAFRVEISANAQRDGESILDWLIAQGAGERARRWYQGMSDAIRSLSHFPGRCSIAPESKNFSFEVRQLLYGSARHRYRVLFTVEGNTVTILHIHHGRRDRLRQ